MIAYRFQAIPEHPRHGVLIKDDETRPAMFLTPRDAKQGTGVFELIQSERVTIARIQIAVAAHYGLPSDKMRSGARARRYSHPRQLAMLLARELTKSTLPAIGERFGGRDHTTVIHGIKAARNRIETDPGVDDAYQTIRKGLVA